MNVLGTLSAPRMAVLLASLAVFSPEVHAQVRDSTRNTSSTGQRQRDVLATAHSIRWYEVAVAVGGVAAISLVDQPLRKYVQNHRTRTGDDIAGVFQQQGEPVYYVGISLGIFGTGLILGDDGIKRAGGRVIASVFFSAVASESIKRLVGRSRPNADQGAFQFHPFSSRKDSTGLETRGSMPSGHVTAAFAVATALADDINNDLIDVILFVAASGSAYARITEDRHWLSDTVMGAVTGITLAKVVSGRGRLFGLRPPMFLIAPDGTAGAGFQIPF